MSWGAVAGAGIGLLSSSGKSQGGTTTQSRDPWSVAQPWLIDNLTKGQNLQNYYAQNPFNAQQTGAYKDLSQGNAYMKELVPSLLQQFSQSSGFDRTNPQAKPQAINFNTPNLGFGNVAPQQQSAAPAPAYQPQAAAPAAATPNMDDIYREMTRRQDAEKANGSIGW